MANSRPGVQSGKPEADELLVVKIRTSVDVEPAGSDVMKLVGF